jgi:hypothetical protein
MDGKGSGRVVGNLLGILRVGLLGLLVWVGLVRLVLFLLLCPGDEEGGLGCSRLALNGRVRGWPRVPCFAGREAPSQLIP